MRNGDKAKEKNSKDRVDLYGEVFTPPEIVKEMLDLVKEESYKLDATFLEPACGNGNFLVEILERKLKTAKELGVEDFDRNVFIAVSSIYGIDILGDNVEEAKERMMSIIEKAYNDMGLEFSKEMQKALRYVIDTNIIWGDSLVGVKYPDKVEPIIIAEWKLDGDIVTRKDYIFRELWDSRRQSILDSIYLKEYQSIHFKDVHNMKSISKVESKTEEELWEDL